MRTLSFILAFAFVLAGPTLAGSPDSSLPGVGTFAYSGSPIVTSAPVSRCCGPLRRELKRNLCRQGLVSFSVLGIDFSIVRRCVCVRSFWAVQRGPRMLSPMKVARSARRVRAPSAHPI